MDGDGEKMTDSPPAPRSPASPPACPPASLTAAVTVTTPKLPSPRHPPILSLPTPTPTTPSPIPVLESSVVGAVVRAVHWQQEAKQEQKVQTLKQKQKEKQEAKKVEAILKKREELNDYLRPSALSRKCSARRLPPQGGSGHGRRHGRHRLL
jgi:hypothetical protein